MYEQDWKIDLGKGYEQGIDLLKMLQRAGVHSNGEACKVLADLNYNITRNPRTVILTRMTPRRLGCVTGKMYKSEFYCKAERNGLKPPHPDGATLLRLQITKQFPKDVLFFGMEPIPFLGNKHKEVIFRLSANNKGDAMLFQAIPMSFDTLIDIDDTFIFSK